MIELFFFDVEICSLQQWFEYCPATRKRSCPICKQACQANKVCRLYFQSVGDASDAAPPPRSPGLEVDPEVLRAEVRRLEAKASGLVSALEHRNKDLEQLNEEVISRTGGDWFDRVIEGKDGRELLVF